MHTRNQHFVPRFYLERFVDKNGHVWSYSIESGDVYHRIPKDTAKQRDFYTLENDDGSLNFSVEEQLSQIETAAAPHYQELSEGSIPEANTKPRLDIAYLLALQYLRTPLMREHAANMISGFLESNLREIALDEVSFAASMNKHEERIGEATSEAFRSSVKSAMLDTSRFRMQIPKERTLVILKSADLIAKLLNAMHWSSFYTNNSRFITSDNPVWKIVDPRSISRTYGDGGFLNKTAQVVFPISPQRILVLHWSGEPRFGPLTSDGVDYFNHHTAAQACAYIYADSDSPSTRTLAKSVRGRQPGAFWVDDAIGPKAKVEVSRRRTKGRAD